MIDMLGVAFPSTAMMVWIRAPPSASWVPMVCRNRCAVIVALPAASTKPAAVQASARAMSNIYSTLSDPTVKQQYQDAMDRHLGPEVNLAGPAADALREHRLDPEAVSWLQTNFLKTELELGHCLRTPAEGPCECDLVLTCSKFLTTSDYGPAPSRSP